MNKYDALAAIVEEYEKAIQKFPPMHSPHEGLAILQEEFEELKIEVFTNHNYRSKDKMRKEATQVGAMALRFIVDCT